MKINHNNYYETGYVSQREYSYLVFDFFSTMISADKYYEMNFSQKNKIANWNFLEAPSTSTWIIDDMTSSTQLNCSKDKV